MAESFNEKMITAFRRGDDPVEGMFARADLLLLHTTGARSGQPRVSPLRYFRDGERLLIIASYAGADTHPAWYHNLLADPRVRIERADGDQVVVTEATARPLPEPERTEVYARLGTAEPGFAQYQARTERVIPVVALTLD